jgi:hypothetical protein
VILRVTISRQLLLGTYSLVKDYAMPMTDIFALRILPPLAIARMGDASQPMDNYDIDPDPDNPSIAPNPATIKGQPGQRPLQRWAASDARADARQRWTASSPNTPASR